MPTSADHVARGTSDEQHCAYDEEDDPEYPEEVDSEDESQNQQDQAEDNHLTFPLILLLVSTVGTHSEFALLHRGAAHRTVSHRSGQCQVPGWEKLDCMILVSYPTLSG